MTNAYLNVYASYHIVMDDDGEKFNTVVIDLIENKGYDMIIGTSYSYQFYMEPIALDYPHIKFLAISGHINHANMINGFGAIYQAKYLAGRLAGLHTKTNKFCYVAAFKDNSEVIRGLNAFLLGAKAVNPDVTMDVYTINSWSNASLEAEAFNHCVSGDPSIDIVAQHTDHSIIPERARDYGIKSIGYNSDMRIVVGETVLTSPILVWGPIYIEVVGRVLEDRWVENDQIWLNISSGIVDLAEFSIQVTEEQRDDVLMAKELMFNNSLRVFCGELVAKLNPEDGDCLTLQQLLTMDTFVDDIYIQDDVVITIKEIYLTLDGTIGKILFVLIILSLLMQIIVLVIVIIKRDHKAIKIASYKFCIITLIGSIIAIGSGFLYLGKPTLVTCVLRESCIGLGFVLIYGCIFAKTWRVYMLFIVNRLRLRTISDGYLFKYVFLVLSVQAILLTIWFSVEPPMPVMKDSPFLRDYDRYITCEGGKDYIFRTMVGIWMILITLFGCGIAFNIRKVKSNSLGEAQKIGSVIYNMLFINTVILPLMLLVELTLEIYILLICADIMWICNVTTAVVFWQRAYAALTRESEVWMESKTAATRNSNSVSNQVSFNMPS
eukprot:TRINITY_DN2430_c0_g1_i3.p1 TRINITY_DN2430_c0_g1~~TRINITY_DN2430_c0_g1_i3.p1  ORF type:complete len:663 (+),score=86.67 TRINITY_DN2430_c0_g1_i3:174-1991(+)